MRKPMNRRAFMRRGAALGAASLAGGAIFSGCGSKDGPETEKDAPKVEETPRKGLVVITGEDVAKMTRRAVERLGGMNRFVPKGAKVCVLPNSQKNNPGVFTHPELVRAVVSMCLEAGAAEVSALSWLPRTAWESTGLAEAVEGVGGTLTLVDRKNEELFKRLPVPRGKTLTEARIMERFFDHNVFINVPICKDHAGNRFTGTLKNHMGLSSPKTNRAFHTGDFKNDDIEHLDQCIADLNTILKPHLNIVDATEFIITGGPFGPGELKRANKVVAGTDRVAADAYCAGLWGLVPEEIIMIARAHAHGLGEIDLTKVKIHEETV